MGETDTTEQALMLPENQSLDNPNNSTAMNRFEFNSSNKWFTHELNLVMEISEIPYLEPK